MRCLIVCSCLFLAAASGAAQPRITVREGTTLDFGKVYRGNVVERGLTIENTGTEVLVIGLIEASCGCTGTVLSDKTVPPGKTTSIAVTFNSRNFDGPIVKNITINSNAENNPRLQVEFKGTVIPEFGIDPAQFWFRDAQVGRQHHAAVSITNNGTETVEFRDPRTSLKGLAITLPQAPLPPGSTDTIRAVFSPKAEAHIIIEDVRITTTSSRQQELVIPVFGNAKEYKFE